MLVAAEWSSNRKEIGLPPFKLMTYERLESMSLLELALWKVNIDGYKAVYDSTTDHGRDEESSAKRPGLDMSNLDRVDRQSTVALMLSYRMCCLFSTEFADRTILRLRLAFEFFQLAIHKCPVAVINCCFKVAAKVLFSLCDSNAMALHSLLNCFSRLSRDEEVPSTTMASYHVVTVAL